MIAIINYGLGNIEAFVNIYRRQKIDVRVASVVDELEGVTKLILPGVGAFDWAMTRLNASGLRGRIDELVLKEKVPVLGICVGMQMMGSRSEEGKLNGLDWISGEVCRFDTLKFSQKIRLPHMGWNDVVPRSKGGIFSGLGTGARFYFLHSYYFSAFEEDEVLADTDYNGVFASSVHSANVYGVQFHPEKSHHWGGRLLENFARL